MDGDVPIAALVARFYAERNREFALGAPVTSVGRAPDNSVRIPDPRVSDRHVRITREDSRYVLEVLASDVVTRLNGESVTVGERHPLAPGDVISLSNLDLEFTRSDDPQVPARLLVLEGVHRGKIFRVDGSRTRVGRAIGNDIQFPDRTVSRHHCFLRRDEQGGWWIEDRESTNGTLLNGVPVEEPARLEEGDEVMLGLSRFRFRTAGPPTVEPVQKVTVRWN